MSAQKLCSRCEFLTLKSLENGHVLYPSVDSLREEAKRDGACNICSLIWWSLRFHHFYISRALKGNRVPVQLFLNPPPSLSNDKLQRIDIIVTRKDTREFLWLPQKIGQPWHLGPPDEHIDICRAHLTLYSGQDDPLENRLKFRQLAADSQSENCFRLATSWLNQCLLNHGSSCRNEHDVHLPTRLVDVGSFDGLTPPKLIATAGEKLANLNYVALSYCWGKIPFLKTTPDNLKTLMISIPWNTLPNTVRDAIIVARRLQVRYLWVDSLCIIQGPEQAAVEDWKTESAKMHDIYGAAFVTIAAASAANAHEGLFSKRPAEAVRSCRLNPSSCYPGSVLLGADPPRNSAEVEALHTRGWALQEQLLSNRIMTYGASGLSWKCCKSVHQETVTGLELGEIPIIDENSLIGGGNSTTGKVKTPDQRSIQVHSRWKKIIEDYSRRDLTFMTDKLPALYGMSELIERSTKDKYLAGLWRSDLVPQLLWKHCGKPNDPVVAHDQTDHFRAPSWSWASVDSGVQFIQGYQTLPGVSITCRLNTRTSQQLSKLKTRPLHVFGLVRRVPSIRCEHSARYYGGAEKQTLWISYADSLRTYLDDVNSLPSNSILDRPDYPKQLLNVFFLFLGRKEGDHPSYWAGLILVSIEKTPFTFKRVGVFEGFPHGALVKGNQRSWARII